MMYITCYKGKPGSGAAPQVTQVAPAPPVEEAGIVSDEEDSKSKLKTAKSSLKIPLATSAGTGLKV
jgi:hypothetical protein